MSTLFHYSKKCILSLAASLGLMSLAMSEDVTQVAPSNPIEIQTTKFEPPTDFKRGEIKAQDIASCLGVIWQNQGLTTEVSNYADSITADSQVLKSEFSEANSRREKILAEEENLKNLAAKLTAENKTIAASRSVLEEAKAKGAHSQVEAKRINGLISSYNDHVKQFNENRNVLKLQITHHLEQIDAFNSWATSYNERRQALNNRIATYQIKFNSLKMDNDQYREKCVGTRKIVN